MGRVRGADYLIILFEPHPERDVPTGGYVYNQAMGDALAAAGVGERRRARGADLTRAVSACAADDVIILDALFGAERIAAACGARTDARLLLHWTPHLNPELTELDAAHNRAELGRMVASCEKTVVTAHTTAREVEDLDPRTHPAVVTPGVHDCFRRRTSLVSRRAAPTVICVGPMHPLKAPHLVAHACATAPSPRPRLLFVGDTGSAPSYFAAVRDAASDLNATFLGPRPHHQLAELMARADLYASASRLESYGMATAEAAAVGLPMVVTKVGDVASSLANHPGACTVPSLDADAFVTALQEALEAGPSVPRFPAPRRWGDAAREFVAACR